MPPEQLPHVACSSSALPVDKLVKFIRDVKADNTTLKIEKEFYQHVEHPENPTARKVTRGTRHMNAAVSGITSTPDLVEERRARRE